MPKFSEQLHCRGCGHPIKFIKTPADRRMPVDPRPVHFTPDERGDALLANTQGQLVRCFINPEPKVYDPARVGYVPHWQTCPKAANFKKAGKGAGRAESKERDERRAEREALAMQTTLY